MVVQDLSQIANRPVGVGRVSGLAQRARGHDGIRLLHGKVAERIQRDILPLLVVQRQAAERSAAADARLTVLRGFHQVPKARATSARPDASTA